MPYAEQSRHNSNPAGFEVHTKSQQKKKKTKIKQSKEATTAKQHWKKNKRADKKQNKKP